MGFPADANRPPASSITADAIRWPTYRTTVSRAIARQISRILRSFSRSAHGRYSVIVDQIDNDLIAAKLIPDDRPSGADLDLLDS